MSVGEIADTAKLHPELTNGRERGPNHVLVGVSPARRTFFAEALFAFMILELTYDRIMNAATAYRRT